MTHEVVPHAPQAALAARQDALLDALPAIVWEADGLGERMTYVSPRARDLLGHDPADWVGIPGFWDAHVHPDDLEDALRAIGSALEAVAPVRIQYRFRAADGTWHWFQDSVQTVADEGGGKRLVGVMVDITQEHLAEEARTRERSLAALGEGPDRPTASPPHKAIVDNLLDGVYYVDADRRITYWNRGAERLTGYRAAEVLGRQCHDNILCHVDADGRNLCLTMCPLASSLEDGQGREVTVWLRHANGSRRPVLVRTAPIRADNPPRIVGAVEIFSDATGLIEAQDAAAAARQDALTDPLTGLANRRLLDAVLASRKDDLDRHQLPFGLLMIDIDHFKSFNDTYGHDVGDEALKVVAATLKGAVRGGDTLVRWGGEEFAVVAPLVDAAGLSHLAERILRLMRAARVRTGARSTPIRVSIGGSLALPAESVDLLFARADGALRAAEEGGRDRFLLDDTGSASPEVPTPGVVRP